MIAVVVGLLGVGFAQGFVRHGRVIATQIPEQAGKTVRSLAPLYEPLRPGRHHLRQHHEPGGVSGGRRIENDQVVARQSVVHQVRNPLEDRSLLHARR